MNTFPIEFSEQPEKELEYFFYFGFRDQAMQKFNYDGDLGRFVFYVKNETGQYIGAILAATFWGSVHIKNLYVMPEYRGKGLGKTLLQKTLDYGISRGCRFAVVETLKFQAIDFYKKLGFKIEFGREGFNYDQVFYYLRKELV